MNLQDKEAIKKELERLRKKHRRVSLIVFVIILIMFIPIIDFIQVRKGGIPRIAITSPIENGVVYKGLGYRVTVCEDGTQTFGTLEVSCSKKEINTFNELVYQAFKKYAEKEKLLDFSILEVLEFDSLLFDESHEDGSNDYIVDIHYVCKENTECFTSLKNVEDKNHYQLYLTLDRMNDVVNEKSENEDNLAFDMAMFLDNEGQVRLMTSSFVLRN